MRQPGQPPGAHDVTQPYNAPTPPPDPWLTAADALYDEAVRADALAEALDDVE